MAFNPIRDLSKVDRDQSIKQLGGATQDEITVIANRLKTTTRLTSQLLEVIRRKNALFKTDLEQIKTLDRRIKRVIPIIPGMTGVAGARFGRGGRGPDGQGPSMPGIPLFPTGPFGPQPPGPGAPGPQPQPTPDVDIIKEDVEEPTVVDEPLDERSPEYNRRKQEEAKRKREQERIKEGVPATPGQKPDEQELEEEAQPERKEPGVVPTTPFVPTPPQVPAEPKFDPQKILEGLEARYGPALPFVIPDRVTQIGQPMALPRVDIPNFDPNNPKQRRDLDQKIFTYIFKNPSSRFAKKMETGVILPDGTMIIRRPGQQIMYSEPLTQEQLNLIRLMGVVNLSQWLPVVPIRGMGPRRGTVPGISRPNRPLKPNIERYRQQLEQSFQQPSVPGAQPTREDATRSKRTILGDIEDLTKPGIKIQKQIPGSTTPVGEQSFRGRPLSMDIASLNNQIDNTDVVIVLTGTTT